MNSDQIKRRIEAALPAGLRVQFQGGLNPDDITAQVLDGEEVVASMTFGEIRRLRYQGRGFASELISRIPARPEPTPEPTKPKRRRKKKVEVDDAE